MRNNTNHSQSLCEHFVATISVSLAQKKLKYFATFLLTAMVGFSSSVLAQNESNEKIPLDHFYVERQGAGPIQKALRNFHFGAYIGVGRSYLSNSLRNFGIYQAPGLSPELFTTSPPEFFVTSQAKRYTNWINNAGTDITTVKNYVVANPGAAPSFRGHALNIPLAATVHYEYKKFRFGVGYSYELMSLTSFKPTSMNNKIAEIRAKDPMGFVRKYWAMAGYSFYRWNDYLFTADLQVGSYKLKKNYNTSQVKPSAFFSFGVNIDRELSEYLKVFVRPAIELKSYDLKIPGSGSSIHYANNLVSVNIGFTYSIPQLHKCVIKQCRAQVDHHHGNREYRSRVHPIYKKQNPGYGENYPGIKK